MSEMTPTAEERHRLLVEGAEMGTWRMDVHTGATTFSPRMTVMHLFPQPLDGAEVTMPYNKVMATIHPDDFARVDGAIRRAIAEAGSFKSEHRVVGRDGQVRWIEGHGRAYAGEDGEPPRVEGVALDITERKRVEEALRQSEARYRAVFEALAEGITVQDATGLWQEANSSAERILDLSREQMAGRTSADPRWRTVYEDGSLLPGEEHPPMVALRTGQPVRAMRMGVHRPDGTLAWLSANAELIIDPETGEATGVVTSFFDITAQREAQATYVAAEVQQRTLLRDVLASVTEGKLLLSTSPAQLPAPLSPVGEPIPLTREEGPRALRLRAQDAAQGAGHSEERQYDLLTAVSEAGMNAILHGGGGTGWVSVGADGTVQVRVEDHGGGIAMENLPRATLSRGFTTAGTLGHGLKMMLETADRLSLLTGPSGTTLVLEMERERPLPAWL